MHERKRLHITPFNSDLLPIVLPQNLLQHATNISFHAIQTSPEKNYGYVDLPAMDAEKLKKKLNGSILRGSKMRVDDARAEKAKKATKIEAVNEVPIEDGSAQDKPKRGKRKAEKSDGVIPGVELPHGRKVRRGWTEPAPSSTSKTFNSKFKKHDTKPTSKPSSFTSEPECLFKTKLPPNAATNDTTAKKRKRDQPNRDIIVHEYANTKRHATFLRDNQGPAGVKPASEFVEGRGWIDQDGKILEEDPVQGRTRSGSIRNLDPRTNTGGKNTHSETVRSSSGIPSIHVSSVEKTNEAQDSEDETSSSGTSSISAIDDEGNALVQAPKRDVDHLESSLSPAESEESDPNTVENQARGMSINDSSPTTKTPEVVSRDRSPDPNAPVAGIHPLEGLFKKPNVAASGTPRKPSLAVSTSFNFFEPDMEEGNDNSHLIPHTPFTQQDFRQRCQRSAAPTPDTAAPGRTFENLWETRSESDDGDDNDDDQNDEENEDDDCAKKDDSTKKPVDKNGNSEDKEGSGENPESDFSKWFWEHRGETNRAWKRRRREAAKERRQTVNKKS